MSKTSKKVPAVKNGKSIGVYMKRYWQLYLTLSANALSDYL